MDSQRQQAAERIKQANNILVTVSSNPSVDQLAACIGLTLALNKAGKHATAVFSGIVPSTIEFLQPEKTIEKNTDSLRDFIIALDKSKADKLRYKVEDRVVKIFITPYRTSINEKDLEFSQGDFNVDVVVALGVHSQAELDQAITAHGRILHDATVVTVNVKPGGELGGINWLDPNASSLSELAIQLIDSIDKKLTDSQIATALLTGIVAETDRFSNAKTSPQTMSISAELMGAGANQQLVATKLEEQVPPAPQPAAPIAQQEPPKTEGRPPAGKPADDGTLEIAHDEKPAEAPAGLQAAKAAEPAAKSPGPPQPVAEEKNEPIAPRIHIDEQGALKPIEPDEGLLPPVSAEPPAISYHDEPPKMILEPPVMGGQLTASAAPGPGPFKEPEGIGMPKAETPSLARPRIPEKQVGPPLAPSAGTTGDETPSGGAAPADSFLVGDQAKGETDVPDMVSQNIADEPSAMEGKTLTDIERDVHSSHLGAVPQQDTLPSPPSSSTPTMPMNVTLPPVSNSSTSTAVPPPGPMFGAAANSSGPVAPALPADDTATSAPVLDDDVPDVNSARDAVAQAINASAAPQLEPIQALNAQPMGMPLGGAGTDQPGAGGPPATAPADTLSMAGPVVPSPGASQVSIPEPSPFSVPDLATQPFPQFTPGQTDQVADPNAPPPVPPPMMPPPNPY